MKKKNRNGNTFGIRHEQFVCLFLVFFFFFKFKYNPSCDEF